MALTLACSGKAQAASLLVSVNKSTQTMSVALNGRPLWVWPVSTGRAGYATPSGRFTPFRLEEDHYSREWDDAPMPHAVFFTKDGHAIHGTLETRRLGRRASHGCIRLSQTNAARLFNLIKKHGLANTRIAVFSEKPAASPPLVATRPDPFPQAPPMELAPTSPVFGFEPAGVIAE